MDKELLDVFREQTELGCRNYLSGIFISIQEYPEEAQSIFLMKATEDLKLKVNYSNL